MSGRSVPAAPQERAGARQTQRRLRVRFRSQRQRHERGACSIPEPGANLSKSLCKFARVRRATSPWQVSPWQRCGGGLNARACPRHG